jgi:putative ABC transport system permease protein
VAADDEIGAPNTVILSHTYWQRRFGGAPDVLGKTLTIGAELSADAHGPKKALRHD